MRAQINLPAEFKTYREYVLALLAAEHPLAQAHYRAKFAKFIGWHRAHGSRKIADAADQKLESAKKVASYRRMAKVLVSGDFFCSGLSFTATKAARATLASIEAQTMRKAA